MVKPVYGPITFKDGMTYAYLAGCFLLAFLQFTIFKLLIVGKLKVKKAKEYMDLGINTDSQNAPL